MAYSPFANSLLRSGFTTCSCLPTVNAPANGELAKSLSVSWPVGCQRIKEEANN